MLGDCNRRVHRMWRWRLPGCGWWPVCMQGLHDKLWHWHLLERQLHDDGHARVQRMRSGHVSRCEWHADGVQGMCGEYVPEYWQPVCLRGLHTVVQHRLVSCWHMQHNYNGQLFDVRCWRLPGCGGQPDSVQDMHDDL